MTPLLLTLASLTPGDGGPGGGAAREPVAVDFGGVWDVTFCRKGEEPRRMALGAGGFGPAASGSTLAGRVSCAQTPAAT
jgi:hypothetical protein